MTSTPAMKVFASSSKTPFTKSVKPFVPEAKSDNKTSVAKPTDKGPTRTGLPRGTRMLARRDGKRTIVTFYHFDQNSRKVTHGSAIDTDDSTETKDVDSSTNVKTKAQRAKERKIMTALCSTAIKRTIHSDALNFTQNAAEWSALQKLLRAKNAQIQKLQAQVAEMKNTDGTISQLEQRQVDRDRIDAAFRNALPKEQDGGKSLARAKRLKRRFAEQYKHEAEVAKRAVEKRLDLSTRMDLNKYLDDVVQYRARDKKQVVVEF